MIAKAFTVLLAVAGLANADLNFSKDEVMCNCKAPYNTMYVAYQKSVSVSCAGYPVGTAGQPSCVANALGYLTNDGRAFDHEKIKKDFANLPFVASCDPSLPELAVTDGYIWHGSFSYADLDRSIGQYFQCINSAMDVDCSTALVNKVRTCKPAN